MGALHDKLVRQPATTERGCDPHVTCRPNTCAHNNTHPTLTHVSAHLADDLAQRIAHGRAHLASANAHLHLAYARTHLVADRRMHFLLLAIALERVWDLRRGLR